METELDEIAEGGRDHVQFAEGVSTINLNRWSTTPIKIWKRWSRKKSGELCPDCGGELVIRQGRFGKFISCLNYPQCKYTRKIEAPEKEKPEPTGKICPECGGELLKRKSRYGNYFLGCSNFPKCRHIENIEGEKKPTFRRKGKKKDDE